MAKHVLFALLLSTVLLGVPGSSMAAPSIEIVENDIQTITLSISEDGVLRVTGAAGQALYIYNVTGVRVMSVRVDGADKSFALNLPKGCYIVKVGKVVRKISIR